LNDKIIVLAASLGGPPLVNDILSGLPGDFTIPIVVMQQMESDFSEPLTSAWSKTSTLRMIRLAQEEQLRQGCAYVLPYCTCPAFVGAGTGLLIKPRDLKPEADICEQWNLVLSECARVFGENVILVLLSSLSLQDGSLRKALSNFRKSCNTIICCKEAYDLAEHLGGPPENPSGYMEMEVDQIVSFLQNISAHYYPAARTPGGNVR